MILSFEYILMSQGTLKGRLQLHYFAGLATMISTNFDV
jgi:hypothetical protein